MPSSNFCTVRPLNRSEIVTSARIRSVTFTVKCPLCLTLSGEFTSVIGDRNLVRKLLSSPLVVPSGFSETILKWYLVQGARDPTRDETFLCASGPTCPGLVCLP